MAFIRITLVWAGCGHENAVYRAFRTEYRRLQKLYESNCLIKPKPYVVGSAMYDKRVKGKLVKEIVPLTAQPVPIASVLKCFFSLPGVLEGTLSYMSNLERQKGVLTNFVQGELWREKKLKYFKDKIVIPLFFYFDDFEINNPLGSHAVVQKLGATYFSIPCLPPEHRSQLINIFLALLSHAADRHCPYVNRCNEAIFRKMIDQINVLQEKGLEINGARIYFAFGVLLGDNEGLNSTQGFIEGPNANYYCRLCTSHKKVSVKAVREDQALLRNENDYEQHVTALAKDSGVKEYSIWNNIVGHHVYKNCVVDLLHDMAEGCLKYGMFHVVSHIVSSNKNCTLEIINSRLKGFDLYSNGISNRPPPISHRDLEIEKRLQMSGSEMLNFVLVFPFLIGDLVVCDKVWQFYLVMRKLVYFTYSHSLQADCAALIDSLVEEHHTLYLKLFKDTLKPKHHNVVHFGRVLKSSGPLIHLSTIRYEAKHRLQTKRAAATTSRKNITHTIALKEQLQLCHRFLSNIGIDKPRIEFGPTSLPLNLCDECFDVPVNFGPNIVETSWITDSGTTYRVGTYVLLSFDSPHGLPIFGRIKRILCDESCNVCFECHHFESIGFNENIFAYEVFETKVVRPVLLKSIYTHSLPIFCVMPCGEMFLSLKFAV